MTAVSQKDKAIQFRSLHMGSPILVLPNAWDAASARLLEYAGFPAIGTTSSGVAATFGYPDGQRLSRELLIGMTAHITRVVDCPVSADIEAGYGNTIEEVVRTVQAIIEAGAVGINIEDSLKQQEKALVDVSFQVELIQALRRLGESMDIPLVINARTDVFLLAIGDPAGRFEHAVRRANAYRQAGADCLFFIGVSDASTIGQLVQATDGPINILAGPKSPSIPELTQLGVARVSFGSGLMRAALGELRLVAQELLEHGTYQHMAEKGLSNAELQRLWRGV